MVSLSMTSNMSDAIECPTKRNRPQKQRGEGYRAEPFIFGSVILHSIHQVKIYLPERAVPSWNKKIALQKKGLIIV
jgi:hypothetical protein